MDNIKKALERARKERDEHLGAEAQIRDATQHRIGALRVEYEQTRIIPVSKETLLKNRIVAADENHQASAAYKVLRTEVLRRMHTQNLKTLAITSSAPTEGKSLTSVNLAISIAQQFTSTVLLAEFDLRRPSIASLFDYRPAHGLTEHLLEGMPLEDVLFNPGIERLVILPAGSIPARSSEILRTTEIASLITELRGRYEDRYVLLDLPPLLVGDETLSILPHVDGVILVIEDGKTFVKQLTRAAELLQDFNLIGSVLNKCEDSTVRSYYEYY